MVEPRIALIDLGHPALLETNKILRAADVLCSLKADGQAWWARYKGKTEKLIWADVPRQAIISHLPLGDLVMDQDCAELLNLDEFEPGRRTLQVSSRLRERNIVLNTVVAGALGKIAKSCLRGDAVHLHHVREFVGRFVDGWSLNNAVNQHAQNKSAHAFAVAFDHDLHSVCDIMKAFLDGMQEGTDVLAYYARRRRSNNRRVRTHQVY
jgi:hypothetical protein